MKKTKLLGCALVPLIAQTACVMASNKFYTVEHISLHAEPLFNRTQKSHLVEIKWEDSNKGVNLKKLEIIEQPEDPTELTITIPGEVSGQAVSVLPEAFAYIGKNDKDNLQIKLIFKEANGKKIMFPKDCKNMFYESHAIIDINLAGADTSNTTDMKYMFSGCTKLRTLDLSPLDLSKVGSKEMSNMIYRCDALIWLDLSSLDDVLPAFYYLNLARMLDESELIRALKDIKEDTIACLVCDTLKPTYLTVKSHREIECNKKEPEGQKTELQTDTSKQPAEQIKAKWYSKVWKRLKNFGKSISSWFNS